MYIGKLRQYILWNSWLVDGWSSENHLIDHTKILSTLAEIRSFQRWQKCKEGKRRIRESWLFARASFSPPCEPIHKKPSPPPPILANKRERGIFSCLGMATRRLGNMFRREMFKTFGAGEREREREWQATTRRILCNFFPRLLPQRWIVRFIHSLSLSLWATHRCFGTKRGRQSHHIPTIRLFPN